MQTEIKKPWESDAPKKESDVPKKRKAGNPQWKKGVSGNPAGRPKGIVDRRLKLNKLLDGKAEDVLRVVVNAALEGDAQSANIILSRVVPTLRAQDERVEFELDTQASMSDQVEQILKALSQGQLGPDTAKQIIESLGVLDAIRQTEYLKEKLATLEAD